MAAQNCFIDFGDHLATAFSEKGYSYRDLARLASYFWERVNPTYQEMWKMAAKHRNWLEKRTGKRKLKGFWYFAKTLESCMLNTQYEIFAELYQSLTPKNQQIWYIPSDDLVHEELCKSI